MGNFFSLHYWFDMRPGALDHRAQLIYLIFLVILAFFIVLLSILKRRRKSIYTKIWTRFSTFAATNLLIGLFLLFFTYEMLPFLSMRFWFAAWSAGMLAWMGFIFFQVGQIPKIKAENERQKEFNKYIP